jgi:hypothetical protein
MMTAGTLLRVGIHFIGLWALLGGLSSGAYYLHAHFSGFAVDYDGRDTLGSWLYGHAIIPLVFALFCFGFGGRIARFLLGATAEQSFDAEHSAPAIRVLIKLLALYLFGLYAAPMAATAYEFMAVRAGNQSMSELQVTSDLIANGVGIAFSVWLGIRTDSVISILKRNENAR